MTGVEAENSLLGAVRRLIERAQRGNVAVYGISPSGVDGIASYNRRHPNSQIPSGRLFNESLQAISGNTGGRSFIQTDDLRAGITQILAETGNYYLIGYSPSPPGAAGSYRRLEVKAQRTDLEVRSRPGYFVPRVEPSPAKPLPIGLSAISGVLPRGDIALRATASAFIQPRGGPAVVLTVAVDNRSLPSGTSGEVALTTTLFTPDGRAEGTFTQRAQLCQQLGICEISVVIPVTAGRHAMRVAIEHSSSGKVGSVYLDCSVPDPSRRGLILTGLVLEVTPLGPRGTDAEIGKLMPVVPTVRRELAASDRASVFFRVHQGGTPALVAVNRTIHLTNDRDELVLDQSEVIPSSAFIAGRSVNQEVELPISRLRAGRYLLKVQVQPAGRASGGIQQQQLVFSVR